jgi:hypothetical protein
LWFLLFFFKEETGSNLNLIVRYQVAKQKMVHEEVLFAENLYLIWSFLRGGVESDGNFYESKRRQKKRWKPSAVNFDRYRCDLVNFHRKRSSAPLENTERPRNHNKQDNLHNFDWAFRHFDDKITKLLRNLALYEWSTWKDLTGSLKKHQESVSS